MCDITDMISEVIRNNTILHTESTYDKYISLSSADGKYSGMISIDDDCISVCFTEFKLLLIDYSDEKFISMINNVMDNGLLNTKDGCLAQLMKIVAGNLDQNNIGWHK